MEVSDEPPGQPAPLSESEPQACFPAPGTPALSQGPLVGSLPEVGQQAPGVNTSVFSPHACASFPGGPQGAAISDWRPRTRENNSREKRQAGSQELVQSHGP